MKRKLICFLFAAMAFHALEYESVWADGKSRNVNVTVPATINAVFNEDGSNSISEYSVNNQSLVPVHIDNINSTEKNGWSLVPKGEKILKDQKKVSLSINNHSILSGDNEVNIAIPEESTTPLNIDIGRGAYGFDVKGSAFDLSLRYRVGQKDFNLVFNSNGGSEVPNITANNGDSIILPTPSRDGWTFTGWTDSHGVVHQAGESYTVPIGGEIFTGDWIENTSTLIRGSIFNDTINRLKSESSQTITSIVFTNSPISGDKKESAKLVSEVNSNFRSYAYLDGDTIYVSPEREGITIYANRDSSFMFNNQSKLISISFDNFDTSNTNSIRAMFQSCSSLRSLDISKFNTENVTNMGYVFFSCYSLSSADVSNWNTSKVTDMSYMFFSCSRLDRLDVSNWKTGKVKDMSGVFNGCSKLTELNLSSWDTSKVTSMRLMFSGCSGLPSLDISKFKTEAVKTTEGMFRGCSSLQSIDLSNFNTSSLTNIDSMFYSCASLISVDFSNFDTSRVTDMSDLFYRCSKLESITDIEDFNVSNVKNFIGMFESCSSLTRLDFSKWDTRNVINMSKMFYECYLLSEIVGLENLNTENVTNMSEMFKSCRSLTSLDLSNWDTGNVTNMSGMFGSCKLTSLDLSGLDTKNVTDMSKMFSYCYSLESLNLSNWNTGNVKNMSYMFASCSYLTSVIGLEDFDTNSVTNMKNMFYNCRSFVFPKLPNLISSSVDDVTGMFYECFSFEGEITINNPSISTYTSMFESCSSYSSNKGLIVKYVDEDTKEMAKKLISTKSKGSKIYLYEPEGTLIDGASFNLLIPRDATSITFSNDPIPQDKIDSATLVSIKNSFEEVYLWRNDTSSKDWFVSPKKEGIKICSNFNLSGMFNGKPNLSRINFDNFDTSSVATMYRMFAECPSLVELDLSGFNTENVTNMSCMFYNSKKLERINLTGFNTKKVSDMSIMFQKCSNLSEIVGLSSFDTTNVVKMNSMFSHCTSLASLDLSSFITSKVDDMSFVFEGCGNLRSLNISKFNTSKVSNMRSMFDGCSSLTSLDLSNWDTSRVNNMVSMFRNCSNLSNIEGIGSFNTVNVLDMSSMFNLCSKLSELNFSSSWCTEKVTSFSGMFSGCHSLSGIIGLNNFNTSNANNMGSMFSDCFKLTEIDLTSFDTSNVVNMGSMFSNCRLVTSLDVSRFNTSEVTSIQRMFSECISLKSLDLSNFNVSKVANMYSTFYKANSLSSLTGLSEWNTSNVTTMSGLFNGCSSLISVDLTGWNTENVNNMSSMFTGCGKLSSIDVSSFNTANVTDMSGMFSSCNSLTSLNLSNFDTSNVTNMGGMFYGCYGINKLDVSSFNTEKVTSMNTMFYSLATPSLDLSHFNTSKVSNFGMMFYGSKIKNLNVSSFDFSSARDLNYMFQNAGNLVSEVTINNPNLSGNSIATFAGTSITPNSRFVVKYVDDDTKEIAKKLVGTKSSNSNVYLFEKEGTLIGGEAFNKLLPSDITSITFSNNPIPKDKIASATLVSTQDSFEEVYLWKEDLSDNIVSKVIRFITGRSNDVNRYHVSPKNDEVTICANSDCLKMFSSKKELVKINFENFDTSKATSFRSMFDGCSKLNNIKGLNSFDTSNVSTMNFMFNLCSSLTNIDLSSFNTSNVTNMYSMFSYCSSLTSLDVSNFNTAKVRSMGYMFDRCSSLTSLDLSNFNTARVTDMDGVFRRCSKLNSINLSNWDTSKVETMRSMFYECSLLPSIDVSNWVVSKVKNLEYTFYNCSALTNLDVSSWDTSKVTNMGYMFSGCRSIKVLDVSNWSTPDVTNMFGVFIDCSSLTELNLSNWDISKVTNVSNLFNGCSKLKSLSMPNSSSEKLTTMAYMFLGCESLLSIDVGSLNTSLVYHMTEMFKGCSSLTEIIGLQGFNTSNVTDMSNMFEKCSSLTSLDLSSFDTSKVDVMYKMFSGCSNLTEIVGLGNFNISKVSDLQSLFDGCSSLKSVDIGNWDTSKVRILRNTFRGCRSLESLDLSKWNTSNFAFLDNMFYNARIGSIDISNFDFSSANSLSYMFENYSAPYTEITINSTSIKQHYGTFRNAVTAPGSRFVVKYIDEETKKMAEKLVSTKSHNSNVFLYQSEGKLVSGSEFNNLIPADATSITFSNEAIPSEKVEGAILVSAPDSFEELYLWKEDVSNSLVSKFKRLVTGRSGDVNRYKVSAKKPNIIVYANEDCSNMFNRKANLREINFENFNTSKTNNMSRMFNGCTKLASVEGVTAFNTSNVANMEAMFCKCNSLTSLNLANWNTSNVTTMSQMFNYSDNLEELILTGWNTSNVTVMYGMFGRLSNIEVLNLSSFNTGNVTDMRYMFDYCFKLKNIIGLESFNMSKVKTTANMFDRCYKIKSLDLSNWDTSMVDNMSCMFLDCLDLVEIKGLNSLNTSKVTNMSEMFKGCKSITSVDLTGWNTSNVTDMTEMFKGCPKLSGGITISNPNITLYENMFNKASTVKGSRFIVRCATGCEEVASNMVATKSDNSNVHIFENYSITFELNGGQFDPSTVIPDTYNVDSETITLPTPSREGYTFAGWSSSNDGGVEYIEPRNWKDGFIHYETGSIEDSSNHTWKNAIYSDPIPVRKGVTYTVVGYEGDIHDTVRIRAFNKESGYLGSVSAGGSFNAADISDTYTPKEDGYIRVMLHDSRFRESVKVTASFATEIPSGSIGNKTFYAKWIPKKYNVVFDSNYVDSEDLYSKNGLDMYNVSNWFNHYFTTRVDSVVDSNVDSGRYIKLTVENHNNAQIGGPYFERVPLENGKVYTWEANIKASRNGIVGKVGPEQGGILEGLELSDNWETYRYTFTATDRGVNAFVFYFYNSNINVGDEIHVTNIKLVEGSAGSNTESKDYDSEIGNLPTPSRDGYSFLGWYDSVVGGNKIESTTKVPLNGVTYYAHWQPNAYSIKFDSNMGTGSMSSQNTVYGVSAKLKANEFSKVGHSFVGWNTSPFGTGTSYSDGSVVKSLVSGNNGSITLYAQWEANTYQNTINPNNGNPSVSVGVTTGNRFGLESYTKEGHSFDRWSFDGSKGSPAQGMFKDPYFETSIIHSYAGGSVEKVQASSDNPTKSPYEYVIHALNVENANRYSGFHTLVSIKENGVYYVHVFQAKVPKGYRLVPRMNQQESGNIEWLTSFYGTGEWETYSYKYHCDNVRTDVAYPSDMGHIDLYGETNSEKSLDWYLAYSQIFKLVDNSDANAYVNFGSDSVADAQWTPNKYDISFNENYVTNDGLYSDSYKLDKWGFNSVTNFSKDIVKDSSMHGGSYLEFTLGDYTGAYPGVYYRTDSLTTGKTYTISVNIKASKDGVMSLLGHEQGGRLSNVNLTTEWQNFVMTFECDGSADHFFTVYDTKNNFTKGDKIYINSLEIMEGSPGVETQSKNFDEGIGDLPAPVREGYTFLGWFDRTMGGNRIDSTNKVPLNGATYYAQWTPSDNTKYVVNHHQMNLDGKTYSLYESENKTGFSNNLLTIDELKKDYTGFTFSDGKVNDKVNAITNILPDGSRVIDLYYSRNKYYFDINAFARDSEYGWIEEFATVDVYINDELVSKDTNDYYIQHYHGSTFELKNIKLKDGYIFDGVYVGDSGYSDSLKGVIDGNDIKVVLKFVPGYHISYDLDGGDNNSENPNGYAVDGAEVSLVDPTKVGHTFIGWTESQKPASWHKGFINEGGIHQNPTYPDAIYSSPLEVKGGRTYYLDEYSRSENSTVGLRYFSNDGDYFYATDHKGSFTPNKDGVVHIIKHSLGSSTTFEELKKRATLYCDKVSTISSGSRGNRTYSANWQVNSYVNEVQYWIWGLKNGEGNNDPKNAFLVNSEKSNHSYGDKFVLNAPDSSLTPNGFNLKNGFGTASIDGTWRDYNFGLEITQVDRKMLFECDYEPINYKITYNLDGGVNSNSNPSAYNVLYGVELKNPTKSGYTFLGWYNGDTKVTGINVGANANFNSGEDFYNKVSSRTTGDVTLTAKWRATNGVLSYDLQGGDIDPQVNNQDNYVIVPNGTYGIKSHNNPKYVHLHYANTNNGTGVCIHPSAPSLEAKQTLWTFERYKDTPYYYIQGVSSGKMLELSGEYSEGTVSASSAVQIWPQKSGGIQRDFLWCLVPSANGGVKIKNLATGSVLGVINDNVGGIDIKLNQQSDNSNFKGQSWDLIEIDLKDYPDRVNKSDSKIFINSVAPIKSGYEFIGWNASKDGTGVMYQPGDLYDGESSTNVIVLYAQWRPNSYTVVYDSNNASGSMDNQSMSVGKDTNLSPNAFTNNAHRFTGWNTSPYGTGTSYSEGQSVRDLTSSDDTITLYAQWEPINVTFNFNPNNGSDTFTRSGVLGDMVDIESPSKDGHTFKGWDRSAYYGLFGKMNRLADFRDGSFGIVRGYRYGSYNHLGYGDLELVESSKDNPIGSGHEVKITATAPILVGSDNKKTYLGFATDSNTVSNKSYVHTFIAKIPKGVKVEAAFNSLGVGAKVHWYTEQYGTGDWETYSYIVELKSNASHSALGYIYVSGIDESAVTLPFSWNLASSKIMEVTDVTTDSVFLLGSGDSDLTAQWVSNSETHYLNVQGKLDGIDQNSTDNYGTFDMYINDKLVAKDVNDYWVAHPYGTKYEIKNIKALDGKHYTGVSYGNLVGTIGEGPVAVGLKFDSNKYSVEYIANGGTNGDTPISSHVYGTAKVLTQNGFTKSGYSFSHWNTNEYGTGLDYTDGQEVNNLVSEDGGKIRLYAQWKPNKYSVSVDANNGDSNSNSFYSDTLGRYYELVANKAGFNFAGWSKSDDSLGLFGKKCFANSLYTPVVYNNNGDGMVTVESIDGRSQNYPYGYVNISKITSKGAARPYYGGFVDSVMSSAGKVYIHSFVAKLPKGTMISDFRNPIGDTGYSEWLTNRYGTGEWQWYAYKVVCGDSGRFSNFGHVAIESVDNIATALPTNSNPLVWYIGHHNVIDVTDQNSIHNDTFINLGSNDVVTAQWTQAYDLSEEVNTSVNEESVAPSIDESNSTESNSTETNSTESSVEEVEDNDSSNPSTSEEIVVDSDN